MFSNLILCLTLVTQLSCFTYNRYFNTAGHSSLVTTASFFLDRQRFITGSNDSTVKIWALGNSTLLHTLTQADSVTNVGLHPVDNRIFVLVYNGEINVYDGNNYSLIQPLVHPAGAGNYIAFTPTGDKFMIGGFDGFSVAPVIYIYDSATYAQIDSFATTLPVGD